MNKVEKLLYKIGSLVSTKDNKLDLLHEVENEINSTSTIDEVSFCVVSTHLKNDTSIVFVGTNKKNEKVVYTDILHLRDGLSLDVDLTMLNNKEGVFNLYCIIGVNSLHTLRELVGTEVTIEETKYKRTAKRNIITSYEIYEDLINVEDKYFVPFRFVLDKDEWTLISDGRSLNSLENL